MEDFLDLTLCVGDGGREWWCTCPIGTGYGYIADGGGPCQVPIHMGFMGYGGGATLRLKLLPVLWSHIAQSIQDPW
jgi:uncharacterized membrane protein